MFYSKMIVRFAPVQLKIKHDINGNLNTKKDTMTPDYSPRYYKTTSYRAVSLNRKRHVIDSMIADLHDQYFDMIERALEHSGLRQAKEVIKYIMEKP